MRLNYTKYYFLPTTTLTNLDGNTSRCFFNLFLLLFFQVKVKFLFYYNVFFLYFQVAFPLFFFRKKINSVTLQLTVKSLFEKGLIRDLVKLNLIFYKLKLFWYSVFLAAIKEKAKVQLTLLRSPFVNKKARLQYALKGYTGLFSISLKNIWFLHYILIFFKKDFFLKHSTLNCSAVIRCSIF